MNDYLVLSLIFLGVVALSVALLLLVRHSVKVSTLESHHEIAGFIYAIIGAIYAVHLAFVVIVVWEQHDSAELTSHVEIEDIVSVYRNSRGFRDIEVRTKFESLVKDYMNTMLEYEYPAMNHDTYSAENEKSYTNLWDYIYTLNPTNERDRYWFDKTVDAQNELGKNRRARKLTLDYKVPYFMWIVLIFGGVITVAFSYLFGTKNAFAQALMVIALSSTIVLILILISALEHPYSGIIRINPDTYKLALQALP